MRTIWKYPVPIADHFTLDLPAEAKPLCVMVQREEIFMWVLLDPSQSVQSHRFRLAGTGHLIQESVGNYIGTVALLGGDLIFHIFEDQYERVERGSREAA